jgi:hypothetical protein
MQTQGYARMFKALAPACSWQVLHNTMIYTGGLFTPLWADNMRFKPLALRHDDDA